MKCIYFIFCVATVFLIACDRDDYLIDGGVASPYVNMSTYDFLASRPLFDTLVIAIDKAGLKEVINGEVTLFAVTNFTFRNYVDEMTAKGRVVYNDPNYLYSFDSIPDQLFRDSLKMYIFPEKIQRKDLCKEGTLFTNLAGTQLKISLEPQKDDYKDEITVVPEYLYLTYKRGTDWDAWDAEVTGTEKDSKERIQTSGLISTHGIIHVLSNSHTLFYYKR
jgi:hypothetical protein